MGVIFVSRTVDRKDMSGYIDRAANQIADILMREGLDYTQTKAVFKQARARAGLHAPKEHRGSPARLTLEEELRFIDQAYGQGGQVGLMMQVLLETGARVSEFVALRVEDVSLAERAIVIEDGKGGKRREVPMRPNWPDLWPCTSAAQVWAVVRQPPATKRWKAACLHPTAHRSDCAPDRPRRRHLQAHLSSPLASHHGHPAVGHRHGHHRRAEVPGA